jgi:hypothetical protein
MHRYRHSGRKAHPARARGLPLALMPFDQRCDFDGSGARLRPMPYNASTNTSAGGSLVSESQGALILRLAPFASRHAASWLRCVAQRHYISTCNPASRASTPKQKAIATVIAGPQQHRRRACGQCRRRLPKAALAARRIRSFRRFQAGKAPRAPARAICSTVQRSTVSGALACANYRHGARLQ